MVDSGSDVGSVSSCDSEDGTASAPICIMEDVEELPSYIGFRTTKAHLEQAQEKLRYILRTLTQQECDQVNALIEEHGNNDNSENCSVNCMWRALTKWAGKEPHRVSCLINLVCIVEDDMYNSWQSLFGVDSKEKIKLRSMK
jgi:hypothetical protein